MTSSESPRPVSWAPASCSLPTAEQPLREQEFDELFTDGAVSVDRTSPTTARVQLRADPTVAARAAALTVKETSCCSFFTFTLTALNGQLSLLVSVPAAHVSVLDAVADRARLGAGVVSP